MKVVDVSKRGLKVMLKKLKHTSRHSRNIRDLYGGINELKAGYRPRTSFIKDDKLYLLADSALF